MHIFGLILFWVLQVYIWLLLVRMVLSWIDVFVAGWQPKGFLLVILEFVYTVTDPPLKALNRHIRPLRIGGLALDMGFMILFVILLILKNLVLFLL